MAGNETLLRVRDLRTSFATQEGPIQAVDGVSFSVQRGRTLALVGESGCGKSVTSYSIMRLLQSPPARIAAGAIELEGLDLQSLSESRMRGVRGAKISMIFQEPMTSLNPVYTCGSQIVEAIRLHRPLSVRQARALGIDLLRKVGIPEPAQRFDEYPHQLSGGMRQRVMIAMALSCNPRLLIADEPTTALDVTIQAQILELLREIQSATGLGILLITHDLAVVAEMAHTVGVMYASKLVEYTGVERLFAAPLHPYTQGLFRSLPRLGESRRRLSAIGGNVPNPLEYPAGCKFHPRCDLTRRLAESASAGDVAALPGNGGQKVLRRCATCEPVLREVSPRHWCACWEAPGYDSAVCTDPSEGTQP